MAAQIPEQLMKCEYLVAARRRSAIASRPIGAAVEPVDLCIADIGKIDAVFCEPGVERCGTPSLGAHADGCVALIDQ